MSHNTKLEASERSWRWYQDFVMKWKTGTLTETDPVYTLVQQTAYRVCAINNYQDDSADAAQECLVALSKNQYKEGRSLRAYIRKIISNKLAEWYKKDHRKQTSTWDDNADIRVNDQVVQDFWEVTKRMFAERQLRDALIDKFPDLQQQILEVILTYDGKAPSVRKIHEELNRVNYTNQVTRYKVTVAHRRLIESIARRFKSFVPPNIR